MSIKLIVNGFFRSGTTIFWEIINRSNVGVQSFYEPFHPNLEKLIVDSRDGEVNSLHGLNLWDAYCKLNPTVLQSVLSLNPNRGKHSFPDDDKAILQYLDLYHSFDFDVVLQPNRLHFKLDLVAETYGSKIIHIVRNPLCVWESVCRISIEFAKFSKIRKHFGTLNTLRAFDQRKIYTHLIDKFELSSSTKYKLCSFRPFYVFVFNWVSANYFAIKSIESVNGLVIDFDAFLKNRSIDQDILEYSGLEFDRGVVDLKHGISDDSKFLTDFYKVLRDLDLVDKYSYISSTLQSCWGGTFIDSFLGEKII